MPIDTFSRSRSLAEITVFISFFSDIDWARCKPECVHTVPLSARADVCESDE